MRRSKRLRVRLPAKVLELYRRMARTGALRRLVQAHVRKLLRTDADVVLAQAAALAGRWRLGAPVAWVWWLPRGLADEVLRAEAERGVDRSLLLTLAVLDTAREMGLHPDFLQAAPAAEGPPDDEPEVLLSFRGGEP